MLGVFLHALRGPFYSPKAARSRWEHSRKAILAFCCLAHRTVRCTTGHCPVRISFLLWRSRPLALWSRWRTGQSGAPSDRWLLPCVARGLCGRPLARPAVGSADSPVHHQTVRWFIVVRRCRSPESSQLARASLAHRTLSGAPRPSCLWLNKAISFPLWFFLFPALRHNTLVFKTMY
jgi:hypothetical protein